MKIISCFTLVSILFLGPVLIAQDDWENPAVIEYNKKAAHVTFIPFKTLEQALKLKREESPYFKLLNGNWKFNWVENPHSRPDQFYQAGFDASTWREIPVPANWELLGYGVPIYVNQPYEWTTDPVPPKIPHNYNPVGSYLKTFTVPESWKSHEVIIHFGAVKSAMYVWVNGQKVGYSQYSQTKLCQKW